jgi:adenylate cyclase
MSERAGIELLEPITGSTPSPGPSTAACQAPQYSNCERPRSAGEIRDVSLLVADLRGFTTLAERTTPSRMAVILDGYLTEMADVILAQRGMVQDFVGDGILAVFGAPSWDPDHTWHAAVTAVAMQAALAGLCWEGDGESIRLDMGVSVHTGQVFAGTLGAPRKPKYAMVGDTVNTAARLEELNRTLGTSVVLSGEAVAVLKDRVSVRNRGWFPVRGRTHPVEVFELLGLRDVARALRGGTEDPQQSLAHTGSANLDTGLPIPLQTG